MSQVNSVTRANDVSFMIVSQAHHTIYSDWIKPFEACITKYIFAFILAGIIVALWRQLRENK